MIQTILVVCEGNVCRSPMAEALLHARLPDRTVTSAGINALVGMQAAKLSQDVMNERGLELSGHRARQLRHLMCVEADLILVMEREQKTELEIRYPFARAGSSALVNTKISTSSIRIDSLGSCTNAVPILSNWALRAGCRV